MAWDISRAGCLIEVVVHGADSTADARQVGGVTIEMADEVAHWNVARRHSRHHQKGSSHLCPNNLQVALAVARSGAVREAVGACRPSWEASLVPW